MSLCFSSYGNLACMLCYCRCETFTHIVSGTLYQVCFDAPRHWVNTIIAHMTLFKHTKKSEEFLLLFSCRRILQQYQDNDEADLPLVPPTASQPLRNTWGRGRAHSVSQSVTHSAAHDGEPHHQSSVAYRGPHTFSPKRLCKHSWDVDILWTDYFSKSQYW